MLDPQQVIVYRSQSEALVDQYWMAHPELALAVAGVVGLLFLIFFVKFAISWFSFDRKFNKLWKRDGFR